MNFTFFKRQRVLLLIYERANGESKVLSRTKLPKLHNFSLFFGGGRGPPGRSLNFWIFRKKQSAMELFHFIFQNSSPKGSFRWSKINYEILQLSAHSRYLQSGPLKDLTMLTVSMTVSHLYQNLENIKGVRSLK